MINKKVILILFVLMALTQLFVPAKMIMDKEAVIYSGNEFKFKSAPVDPHDPFRGKYITLDYDENEFRIQDDSGWTSGQDVYVLLTRDDEGFAKIKSVSRDRPVGNNDYVKAMVNYVSSTSSFDSLTNTSSETNALMIEFPFTRYYMEESKAYDAELAYRESVIDTTQVTYALVAVKDGDAVLKDVMIDDVSIRDVVKAGRR